jgi:hypothetical protein
LYNGAIFIASGRVPNIIAVFIKKAPFYENSAKTLSNLLER